MTYISSSRTISDNPNYVDLDTALELYFREQNSSRFGLKLDRYLLDEIESRTLMFDILTWLVKNSFKNLIFAEIVFDILIIFDFTVVFKSAFSTSELVLDPCRSSLASETVQILICTQN